MKTERQSTRKRLYTLIGAMLIPVMAIVAMSSMRLVAQYEIDQRVYAYPYKTLKKLSEVQARFRLRDLDADGRRDYAGSMAELEAVGTITRRLAAEPIGHPDHPERHYTYAVLRAGDGGFAMTATPAAVSSEAFLFYYIDQTQVVRAAVREPAGPESPVYWHPLYGKQWTGPEPPPYPPPPEEGE